LFYAAVKIGRSRKWNARGDDLWRTPGCTSVDGRSVVVQAGQRYESA